uniref:Uncharacterized protein n=1 Tax=Glossina austeni TaxID=7395 RepID=A0A1A9V452_GLOAU
MKEQYRYKHGYTFHCNIGIPQFLGIYPQNLSAYRNKHSLAASKNGSFLVVIVMIWIIVCHNTFILSQSEGNDQREASHNGQKSFAKDCINVEKVKERLTNICQLHNEICELVQTLHKMWTYPILALMAYGFLIFTAQLYFMYCVTQHQLSGVITILYIKKI